MSNMPQHKANDMLFGQGLAKKLVHTFNLFTRNYGTLTKKSRVFIVTLIQRRDNKLAYKELDGRKKKLGKSLMTRTYVLGKDNTRNKVRILIDQN